MVRHVLPIPTVLIVFASLALFSSCGGPDLKKALQAETTGKYSEALSLYCEALLKSVGAVQLPDNNRSKFVSPDLWRKEVEKYTSWVLGSSGSTLQKSDAILEGIGRCTTKTEPANTLHGLKIEAVGSEPYWGQWSKAFFAPTAQIDPGHQSLSTASHSNNISLLSLSSSKSYTYEISLVDRDSWRRTECRLFPESSVTLLADPGEHLLVVRSTVTFESGQVWRSPYTVTALTVPQGGTLISAELRTSVNR